ncbi:hypothetical protein I6H55_17210 (plasmid) [Enterococcus casseliflavus]|nr:hypothetical protein I6H55_17210 [Enterococcus casseliflavus]
MNRKRGVTVKRLKMSVFGIFLVMGSIFLLSGCSNSPEAKLADVFEEDQPYYLSNSSLDEPEFKIEKNSDGSLTISNLKRGISETMSYSIEKKEEGLYQYRIVNDEDYGIFEILDSFLSDTKEFNVFVDEENEGYAFVPVSKNFSRINSSLKEVKDIYNEDPQYFVAKYQE